MPLVIYNPQRFDSLKYVEGPAHLLDFAPTIVGMLGYERSIYHCVNLSERFYSFPGDPFEQLNLTGEDGKARLERRRSGCWCGMRGRRSPTQGPVPSPRDPPPKQRFRPRWCRNQLDEVRGVTRNLRASLYA